MEQPAGPVDRETLYNEVWSEPVVVVARKYGLSDVGLLKVCRRMAIPVPTRGYWAKVRAGKVMRKLPLPPFRPDRPPPKGPRPLTAEARKQRDSVKAAVDAERAALSGKAPRSGKASSPQTTEEALPSSPPPSPPKPPPLPFHPLIRDAKARLGPDEGWTNESSIRAAPKEVFDLQVTKGALNRVLNLANKVVTALEARGFVFSVDRERGETIADLDGTRLPICIVEKVTTSAHKNTPAEEKLLRAYHDSWRTGRSVPYPTPPHVDYHPQGRLTVTIGRHPRRNWNDTNNTDLLDRIGEIVMDTIRLFAEIRVQEEAQRQREARYRVAEAKYQAIVKRREMERAQLRELHRDAARYRKAEMLRRYIDAFEANASRDGPLTPEDRTWVEWTRAKADWIDPFVKASDVVLDAPAPKQPWAWQF